MGGDWFKKTSVMKFLPAVVADLDYRMMYQNGQHNHLFKRTLCDNTTLTNYKERVNRLFYYMVY